MRTWLARWLREPLAHFLIAGALIFMVGALNGNTIDAGDRTIVVTAKDAERLAATWTQTWQRPPSPDELDGLIRDHIKEEVYYREALRLGLDMDDPIVRRRMRAKMEFLAAAEVENVVPGDTDLQKLLDQDPARYATEPSYAFDQIFVAVGGNRATAMASAQALLLRLRAGVRPDTLGDAISLPRSVEFASRIEVARQFGEEFAAALSGLPRDEWAGPVVSGFGVHLVRVRAVTAPQRPALAAVRRRLENDWRSATRARREAEAYQALLDGYEIDIEPPQ